MEDDPRSFENRDHRLAFTANQLLAGLAAMESWLDTGTPPSASSFPEALGFNNAFVPPPWPY